jgi:hypothetical protein
VGALSRAGRPAEGGIDAFSLWSDYGAPAQRQWKSPSKRGASIGPKILLAAVVIVAGFIGISGIPQVIDARWTPDALTRLPVMSLSTPDARTKALGPVATTESPSRRAITTGPREKSGARCLRQCRRLGNLGSVSNPRTGGALRLR